MAFKDLIFWICGNKHCGKKVPAKNSTCGFCLTKKGESEPPNVLY